MRRCVVVMTLVLLGAAACGDGFAEVVGRLGVMDCPSEYVEHFTGDPLFDAPGFPTPPEALAALTSALGRPPGTPQVESDAPDEVVYLFTDSDRHRLGRVAVLRWRTGGWLAVEGERCS